MRENEVLYTFPAKTITRCRRKNTNWLNPYFMPNYFPGSHIIITKCPFPN